MNHKEPIWTKQFISVFLTNMSVFVVFYGLVSILPLYAKDALSRTDEEAGLLMTIFLVSAIITRPFTGKLLDIVGKRKMLLISLFFYLICTVLYYFITPFEGLLALRFFQGIWFSIVTTAAGSIAADIVPATRRGAGLGYFVMSTNLAVVVGPFIALYVIQSFSYDALFILMSVLMIIGALVSLLIPKVETEGIENRKKGFTWNDLFEKKAVPIALLAGLVAFSYASVLSYLSIYAQEKDLLPYASLFFVFFAAVMLITRPFTGRIFDEKGPAYILIPGSLLFFFGLFILAFVNSPVLFLIAGAFIGLGYGALIPSMQTLAVQSTSHLRSGYATATFFTIFDTGLAIGSYILGFIAVHMGYRNVYLLSSLILLVVLVLFVLMNRKRNS